MAEFTSIVQCLQDDLDYHNVKVIGKVAGGIVNKAVAVETNQGPKFVKYSLRDNAFDMFNSELESLKLIKETGTITVPSPIKVLRMPEGGAIFVTEYMADLRPLTDRWNELGIKVAKMHKDNLDKLATANKGDKSLHHKPEDNQAVSKFGFHTKTHYGPEFFTEPYWADTWEEYFSRMLLEPQIDRTVVRTGHREVLELWSQLRLKLGNIFSDVDLKPSLTHGDFCSINVGQTPEEAVMFDPCSVYAPYEQDFTILDMEKNFDPEFYSGYHSVLPERAKGYDKRSRLRLLFAQLLISNIHEEEDLTSDAISNTKELLKL